MPGVETLILIILAVATIFLVRNTVVILIILADG